MEPGDKPAQSLFRYGEGGLGPLAVAKLQITLTTRLVVPAGRRG